MSENASSNLPATITPASAPVQSPFKSAAIFDSQPQEVWSSFDPSTPEGKAAIVQHLQGSDAASLGDSANLIVEVHHILAHRVETLDTSTGELVDVDRIVLVREDGTSIACASSGIKRSLQVIFGLYGLPPYSPPLSVRIQPKKTRQGRTTYLLVPVVSPVQSSSPRRAK